MNCIHRVCEHSGHCPNDWGWIDDGLKVSMNMNQTNDNSNLSTQILKLGNK